MIMCHVCRWLRSCTFSLSHHPHCLCTLFKSESDTDVLLQLTLEHCAKECHLEGVAVVYKRPQP